jgi:hypothetical protein
MLVAVDEEVDSRKTSAISQQKMDIDQTCVITIPSNITCIFLLLPVAQSGLQQFGSLTAQKQRQEGQ